MGRFVAAFRVFFRTLFNARVAKQVEQILRGLPASPVAPPTATEKSAATPAAPVAPKPAPAPTQNPAITLLATLQREARLIDFLKEDLSGYSDEQIGAAVREVHRDTAKTLHRLFDIQPILHDAEGARVEVPAGFDAGRYRLTGQVTGTAPYHGALRHHGWEVSRCELPTFTGSATAAKTITPAEVEIG